MKLIVNNREITIDADPAMPLLLGACATSSG